MAFQQPNSREIQNRKILEEIQLKKQMLLKQGVQQSLGPALGVPVVPTGPPQLPGVPGEAGGSMSSSQRSALMSAHANSTGYFITQESSFGNIILPVLPRFDNNK